MKPNWSTLTFVIISLGLSLYAGCQEQAMTPRTLSPDWFDQPYWPTVAPRAYQTEPRITFEKVVHDFGMIGPKTSNLCEFRFTNTGDGVLKIGEVSKTCGCTPFSLTKKEYAPGESGTLKVNYYSDTQRGDTTKQLYVHSNDRSKPEIELAIKAKIVTKVHYEPQTLDLLLRRPNAGCPKITLTSVDNQPFSIRSFTSTGDCVTANYNPSFKATRLVLEPKVDMAKLERTLNGRIEIGLTHPECDMITIALNTLPRFKIAPRSISVSGALPNTPMVKKVRIINNYDEPFELKSSSSMKGMIKVASTEILPNGYQLELEITPPAAGSRTRLATEVLYVTLEGGERLEIPCNVFYAGRTPSRRAATQDSAECKTCKPKIVPFGAWNNGS